MAWSIFHCRKSNAFAFIHNSDRMRCDKNDSCLVCYKLDYKVFSVIFREIKQKTLVYWRQSLEIEEEANLQRNLTRCRFTSAAYSSYFQGINFKKGINLILQMDQKSFARLRRSNSNFAAFIDKNRSQIKPALFHNSDFTYETEYRGKNKVN